MAPAKLSGWVERARRAEQLGVSIIPRLMLDPDPGDVVIKPVAGEGSNRRIAAVRLPTRYLTPAVQEFLSITEAFARTSR